VPGPARFWLFTLKALAFISVRLGEYRVARALVENCARSIRPIASGTASSMRCSPRFRNGDGPRMKEVEMVRSGTQRNRPLGRSAYAACAGAWLFAVRCSA
jgi:hypothetical protein